MESYNTMLLKTKKPGIKEHRPIAVTCWSSKVMCTFIREKIDKNWLESYTTMLPKTRKPGIKEHSPIAVTCWSSKVMCTFIREKIEIHLETRGISFKEQYGFTGGKIELCLFTLNYIANRTFESK